MKEKKEKKQRGGIDVDPTIEDADPKIEGGGVGLAFSHKEKRRQEGKYIRKRKETTIPSPLRSSPAA